LISDLPITDRQSNPAAAAVTAAGCRGFSATAELAVRSVFSAESIDCVMQLPRAVFTARAPQDENDASVCKKSISTYSRVMYRSGVGGLMS